LRLWLTMRLPNTGYRELEKGQHSTELILKWLEDLLASSGIGRNAEPQTPNAELETQELVSGRIGELVLQPKDIVQRYDADRSIFSSGENHQ